MQINNIKCQKKDDDSQVKGDFLLDDLISENHQDEYKIEHNFIKTMGKKMKARRKTSMMGPAFSTLGNTREPCFLKTDLTLRMDDESIKTSQNR